MRKLWDELTYRWVELTLLLVLVGIIVVVAIGLWNAPSRPGCEELGGTWQQIGWTDERYVMYSIKVGEVSVPIYGNRTVAVYDCLGER